MSNTENRTRRNTGGTGNDRRSSNDRGAGNERRTGNDRRSGSDRRTGSDRRSDNDSRNINGSRRTGNNSRNRRRKKRANPVVFVIGIILISVVILLISRFIEKHTASKKKISESDLYSMYNITKDSNEVAVLLNNILTDETVAFYEDGRVYLKYDFVKDYVDDKFYWDSNENVFLYTTANDIIKTSLGSTEYYVTNTKNTVDYQIVKTSGSDAYVAIDFVALYSGMEYSYNENPSRVRLTCNWGEEVTKAKLSKGIKIRIKNSIKSDIVYSCSGSTSVYITETKGKWSKVVTEDGYFGYVRNSEIKDKTTETLTTDFVQPEYTRIKKDGKISMAWHMVTGYASNQQLVDLVTNAKGLNVISPTWYRLSDNNGGFDSLADSSYVQRAHLLGLEVWASVDDQDENSDDGEVFPYTSRRETLINNLVADVLQNGIDGISLDIEYLEEEDGEAFTQFVRELSVKCRANGIVLSIDNKVPEIYNDYYDIEAQGEVADYIIMMGYDEHYGTDTGAGSVASLPWVTDGIVDLVNMVESDKIICAVPFYTRKWTEDAEGNLVDVETLSMVEAAGDLASHGVTANWVEEYGQNYGEYTEGSNTVRIWLEDSSSIEEKLKLIDTYSLAGMAAWRLGLENQELWNTIIKYTN